MENKEEEITIEDHLNMIVSNSGRIGAFIKGMVAAATLQGLDKDAIYSVDQMWASAVNIGCYCKSIREQLNDASLGADE